ncbi:hypothetical protein D6779_01790, partial [Candidatus Parcubacteria bacterium]
METVVIFILALVFAYYFPGLWWVHIKKPLPKYIFTLPGAILGGIIFGIYGFILGGMLGFIYEIFLRDQEKRTQRVLKEHERILNEMENSSFREPSNPSLRMEFLSIVPAMLAKMVVADGEIDDREIREVINFYRGLNFSDQDMQIVESSVRNSLKSEQTIFDYASRFNKNNPNIEVNGLVYALLWKIALADNRLDKTELYILREITNYLGLPPQMFDTFYDHIMSNSNNTSEYERYKQACDLLGVGVDDSLQTVKK